MDQGRPGYLKEREGGAYSRLFGVKFFADPSSAFCFSEKLKISVGEMWTMMGVEDKNNRCLRW